MPARTSVRAVSSPAESSCATIHEPYLSTINEGSPSPSACTARHAVALMPLRRRAASPIRFAHHRARSEEHTSELQSHHDLVCRLLLEKKKKTKYTKFDVIKTINNNTKKN